MMYTELYSFEGTAATDAGKTAATLDKAKQHSKKLLQKNEGAAASLKRFLQSHIPGSMKAGNK